MSRLAPLLPGEKMLPGTANTSRFCSRAWLAVRSAPLCSLASMTTVPSVIPLMMRLRLGKFCASGLAPSGCSETRTPFSTISAASEACSLG